MMYNAIMKIDDRSLMKRMLGFLDFEVVIASRTVFLVNPKTRCILAMAAIQSNEDTDVAILRVLKEMQRFEDENDSIENPFFSRSDEEISILLDLYESAR